MAFVVVVVDDDGAVVSCDTHAPAYHTPLHIFIRPPSMQRIHATRVLQQIQMIFLSFEWLFDCRRFYFYA